MTDPIADMITRIKNALLARHQLVSIPHSKMKQAIAEILQKEGYVGEVVVEPTKPQSTLSITLKYVGKTPAITDVKRLSKPGLRKYAPVKDIPKTLGGYGITIVSTSKGLMTGKQAKEANVGGELVCKIW